MADEEVKQEEIKEETKKADEQPKKDKKGKSDSEKYAHIYPMMADEKVVKQRQKELEKQYKVNKLSLMQILSIILGSFVVLGVLITIIILFV